MNIRYFPDTDTLYIQLNAREVVETIELNENTLLDIDAQGNLVSLTLEHARTTINLHEFSFQQLVAPLLQPT